jgi:hypothetical protein
MFRTALPAFIFMLFCCGGLAQAQSDESSLESEIEQELDNSKVRTEEPSASTSAPATRNDPAPKIENQGPEMSRESADQGKPIYDWSKYNDEREIKHPFAEKGLLRIRKDRTYIYKVPETEQTRAASFHVGPYTPSNLRNPDRGDGEAGATFEENYGSATLPAFMGELEWQFWRSPIGKWGVRLGVGAFIAQGNGHFVNSISNQTPREKFTFFMVPVNLGAIYRMQWGARQLFVPYAEGGGTVFSFAETRDDSKSPKFGGALGAYFGLGVALNLTYFDAMSRIALDREYGINHVYLTAEFRGMVGLVGNYNFTSNWINGGLLMEY